MFSIFFQWLLRKYLLLQVFPVLPYKQINSFKTFMFNLAVPRATPSLPSCSPNFLRASTTRYTHAKHGSILYFLVALGCSLFGERQLIPEVDIFDLVWRLWGYFLPYYSVIVWRLWGYFLPYYSVILESRCSPNKRENSENVRLIKYILLFYFYSYLVSHFFLYITSLNLQ